MNPKPSPLAAVIFDLDGTLVDSRLDFAAMRRDLGIAPGTPILEAIAGWEPAARAEAEAIILRHEHAGADCAMLMPGVRAFWERLGSSGVKRGVFTRNARAVADRTLARLALAAEMVVAREDAPAKPDPAGLGLICAVFGCAIGDAVFVGDYLYDLDAGRRAGMRTLLYCPVAPDFETDGAETFASFDELWERLF